MPELSTINGTFFMSSRADKLEYLILIDDSEFNPRPVFTQVCSVKQKDV